MGSNDTLTLPAESAGPNWDAVPFEVGCARCGHDLRGLSEPTCPSCELEFDWEIAVPIEQLTCLHCKYHLYGLTETRCPECGESFTWQAVLDDYHRQQKPLFEYRWRRKPFSSLIKTWWSTLRPSKFWSQIDMHDPPRVKPLICLACFYIIALQTSLAILLAACNQFYFWKLQASYLKSPQYRWFGGSQKTSFQMFLDFCQGVYNFLLEIELVIAFAIWIISSYLALLIFQQSMRRFKVRNVHLVRVWVYSIPVIPIGVMMTLLAIIFVIGGDYVSSAAIQPAAMFIAAIALTIRSTQVAYKQYLHMPHSWAVAICTQMIALITGLTAFLIARWGW